MANDPLVIRNHILVSGQHQWCFKYVGPPQHYASNFIPIMQSSLSLDSSPPNKFASNCAFAPKGLHEVSQLDAPINMPSSNRSSLRSHSLVTCPIIYNKVSLILGSDYAHTYYLFANILDKVPYLMLAIVIHVFALNNPLLQCLNLDSHDKIEQITRSLDNMAKTGSPTSDWD